MKPSNDTGFAIIVAAAALLMTSLSFFRSSDRTAESLAPPTLITVSISPEARVKATASAGRRELRKGKWSEFTVVIENAAGITAPLFVESEQLMTTDHDTDRDHWLRLSLQPSGPLSGSSKETRRLRLRSRDVGIRTAVLNINAGQGTQDLGFRSDIVLSFVIRCHDDPSLAIPIRKGRQTGGDLRVVVSEPIRWSDLEQFCR